MIPYVIVNKDEVTYDNLGIVDVNEIEELTNEFNTFMSSTENPKQLNTETLNRYIMENSTKFENENSSIAFYPCFEIQNNHYIFPMEMVFLKDQVLCRSYYGVGPTLTFGPENKITTSQESAVTAVNSVLLAIKDSIKTLGIDNEEIYKTALTKLSDETAAGNIDAEQLAKDAATVTESIRELRRTITKTKMFFETRIKQFEDIEDMIAIFSTVIEMLDEMLDEMLKTSRVSLSDFERQEKNNLIQMLQTLKSSFEKQLTELKDQKENYKNNFRLPVDLPAELSEEEFGRLQQAPLRASLESLTLSTQIIELKTSLSSLEKEMNEIIKNVINNFKEKIVAFITALLKNGKNELETTWTKILMPNNSDLSHTQPLFFINDMIQSTNDEQKNLYLRNPVIYNLGCIAKLLYPPTATSAGGKPVSSIRPKFFETREVCGRRHKVYKDGRKLYIKQKSEWIPLSKYVKKKKNKSSTSFFT